MSTIFINSQYWSSTVGNLSIYEEVLPSPIHLFEGSLYSPFVREKQTYVNNHLPIDSILK